MSSMGSFVAIASLMVLFIFCWAIIGLQARAKLAMPCGLSCVAAMRTSPHLICARTPSDCVQTFGQYDLDPGFPNFHNGWYASVAVFQALTLENWAQV